MDYTGTFLTIAEIAVAFAGFASIVSALGTREVAAIDSGFRWPLRGMIVCSLVVVVAALFPLVPESLGLAEAQRWLVSSVFLTVIVAVLLVGGIKDSTMVKDSIPLWARIFALAPMLAALLLSLAGILGFSAEIVRAFYLISLLLLLTVAAVLFASIVLNRIAPHA